MKLRAQITSLRLAQASRIRTIAIGIERAQRRAAASGTTAMPTSAATIWQIASKSRSRARKCSRMPSRAACLEMCTCSAVALVRPTKSLAGHLLEIDLAAAGERPARAATSASRSSLKTNRSTLSGSACSAAKPRSAAPVAIARGDVGAFALLDVEIDVGMLAQEGGQRLRQMLRQARGVGEQMHARAHAAGEAREIAAHVVDIVHDEPGMIEQAFARRGQLDAAAAALEQRDARAHPPGP